METTVRILTDHRIPQSPEWQGATTLIRRQRFNSYLGSIFHVFRVAMMWRNYDVLLSANVRNAALFALARRLLPFGAPKIMALEFRMDDERNSFAWKLKRTFQRFAFQGINLICVSAREESISYSNRLRLHEEKFHYLPWHTNVGEPRLASSPNGFVFAAGRTGRDWDTFAKAMAGLPISAVAVCSGAEAKRVRFPSNVRVFSDIEYEHYRRLLLDARIVVVSLEPHVYSSGQVAFLEAMALGKAVIVTDCVGSRDYIVDGVNGVSVPPRDVEAIRQAILKLISDPEYERKLQMGALEAVRAKHLLSLYVSSLLSLARELASNRRA